MKILIISALALVTSFPAFAAEKYFVQNMVCKGEIDGNPREMHPSYTQILMVFTSFKSTRRDGSLADSLEVKNDYAGPGEKLDENSARFGEVWQMGPLYKSGQRVFRKSLSGRDDDLNLTVKYVQHRRGANVEILEGYWSTDGDVANRKGYKLRCTANVVSEDEIKRIDDNTARR